MADAQQHEILMEMTGDDEKEIMTETSDKIEAEEKLMINNAGRGNGNEWRHRLRMREEPRSSHGCEEQDSEEIKLQQFDDIDTLAERRARIVLEGTRKLVTYGIDDRPPPSETIVLALQHFLTESAGLFTLPIFLAPYLCTEGDVDTLSRMVASIFVICGVQTLLQSTFGSRLPIVQGPSFSFMIPIFSILTLHGECPAVITGNTTNNTDPFEDSRVEFRSRIQEIEWAVLIASLFEMVVGFSGMISILMRFIGPLTIVPTISLIGISLVSVVSDMASQHWGIALLTFSLATLFSQYLYRVPVPCMSYTRGGGFKVTPYRLFQNFPIILAMLMSWLICYILTITDVFPNNPSEAGYRARTDINSDQIRTMPWFYLPYPGQFGLPTVNNRGVLGMIAGCTASIVESIGDYYACAKLSGAPPPPAHAVNRGIGMEGVGGLMAAMWGIGPASTSYSGNIGTIGLTKVASRSVVQTVCLISIAVGLCLKIGAILATIPSPVIGGAVASVVGIVTAIGLSNLQYVDMNSSRNLFIVGVSFLTGIMAPAYIAQHPDVINTGSRGLDDLLVVVLRTSMFVGGVTGFILDNTIPGTPDERGIVRFRATMGDDSADDGADGTVPISDDVQIEGEVRRKVALIVNKCYDLPFGMDAIRSRGWTKLIPFSPTFEGVRRPDVCQRIVNWVRRFRMRCRSIKSYGSCPDGGVAEI